ncbi:hypothetical protein FQN50_006510 [Emmonsiellopsis sp. PD_5]|nr:hypothetical protein FQN50_006510 [Emmonsiellopsis sp. PD_5]
MEPPRTNKPQKPSWKLRHQTTIEDRNRHYDFDDAPVQWRSERSSVDRQYLSTSTELQLRDACALLSQRIKYPDQWKDFDCSTAAAENDQRTSSHYVDMKSPSFAAPRHITPGPGDEHINQEQNMFSSKNERRDVYGKDKYDSGIGMEFDGDGEDGSDHAVEQSTPPETGDMNEPSLSELRAQIHHFGEARRETIIWDEPTTSHTNQHIPPAGPAPIKPKEIPPSASSSSTTTAAKRQSTQTDIDPTTAPLHHTEPLTSTSTASAAIIDTNGLERVLTIDEETQRRINLEQAVMEKMSGGGGVIAPAPNTDKDAALRSNPPTRMATANGVVDVGDGRRASKGELGARWGMREGHQTKYALVKRLSKLGFGRKKTAAGGSNGMGGGDGAVC